MATYPVEFHRRLEQKWESRIEQILSVTGTVPPPRPKDDDDDDEDADGSKIHRGYSASPDPRPARAMRNARLAALPQCELICCCGVLYIGREVLEHQAQRAGRLARRRPRYARRYHGGDFKFS